MECKIFNGGKTAGLFLLFAWFWLGGFNLTAGAETAVINGNGVNVRSGPGSTYPIIGNLSKNTGIDITERRNGWVKVSYGTLTGWVADYLISQNSTAMNSSPLKIYLNGNLVSFSESPVIKDGCTLLPVRELTEKLGGTITWDNNTQTITAQKASAAIRFKIGSTSAAVNGQTKNLSVPAQIINGQTWVPLGVIAEAWGGKINWDEGKRLIEIYCPANPEDKLTAVSICASDVNLRSEPSTAAAIVGLVPNGTKLMCLGEKDGWFQVQYQGNPVWVAGWLATPLENATIADFSANEEEILLPVPASNQDFVRQMKPYAEKVQKGTCLPINLLLAQWAEETGYGTSSLAKFYNNFGGIKDPNTGGFKKYATPDDFVEDIINIYTQHANYNKLLADAKAGADIHTLLKDLTASGYAGSNNYGEKLRTVYLSKIDAILKDL